jgi:hypothetical protein
MEDLPGLQDGSPLFNEEFSFVIENLTSKLFGFNNDLDYLFRSLCVASMFRNFKDHHLQMGGKCSEDYSLRRFTAICAEHGIDSGHIVLIGGQLQEKFVDANAEALTLADLKSSPNVADQTIAEALISISGTMSKMHTRLSSIESSLRNVEQQSPAKPLFRHVHSATTQATLDVGSPTTKKSKKEATQAPIAQKEGPVGQQEGAEGQQGGTQGQQGGAEGQPGGPMTPQPAEGQLGGPVKRKLQVEKTVEATSWRGDPVSTVLVKLIERGAFTSHKVEATTKFQNRQEMLEVKKLADLAFGACTKADMDILMGLFTKEPGTQDQGKAEWDREVRGMAKKLEVPVLSYAKKLRPPNEHAKTDRIRAALKNSMGTIVKSILAGEKASKQAMEVASTKGGLVSYLNPPALQ